MNQQIYNDISIRTDNDIYIGVVGPVRTGKSTFIKQFMDLLVIPNIENKFKKERAVDELPQSGSGKTITTCEPKFVPSDAVKINLNNETSMNVRMIDCVGYMVKDALGFMEDENVRMVKTPWEKEAMPFEKAAELGTRKVIAEHSTIGIVITTDGSITEIQRENYEEAELRVINELKALNKPFTVILNSKNPLSEKTLKLKEEMEEKYSVSVMCLNVMQMTLSDIEEIFNNVLMQFPVKEIIYSLPLWISSLKDGHYLYKEIFDFILSCSKKKDVISDIKKTVKETISENFQTSITKIDLSLGKIYISVNVDNSVFYKIVSEENNVEVKNESELFSVMALLMNVKEEYEKISSALSLALTTGYGIVYPNAEDFVLEEPEITRQTAKYGIKLRANAKSLHIISGTIETEVSPIIGKEEECESFYNKVYDQYTNNPEEIWNTEIFGKSLRDMTNDQIQKRIALINDETKEKLKRAVDRVSNNKNGVFLFWF